MFPNANAPLLNATPKPARSTAKGSVVLRTLLILGTVLCAALAGAWWWLQGTPYAPLKHTSPAPAEVLFEPLWPEMNRPPLPPPAATQAAVDRVVRAPSQLRDTHNVLILGLDRRGYRKGGRTDTIIIAALDEHNGRAAVISIPRDLYVELEGHGMHRINSAYGLAWLAKRDPLKAVEQAIEGNLGIPIHNTIGLDLALFEELVNAAGGIDVVVPCPIKDNFIDKTTPSGRRLLQIEKGLQSMDGGTAAMYARSRHGRSDWSRARRQQAILMGIKRKLASPQGIARLPELLKVAGGALETNLTRLELLQLARRAITLRLDRVHGVVLGWKETEAFRTPTKSAVLIPKPEAIHSRLVRAFSSPAPGARPVQTPCLPADIALQHSSQKRNGASKTPRK